jgi:hypothetical protein
MLKLLREDRSLETPVHHFELLSPLDQKKHDYKSTVSFGTLDRSKPLALVWSSIRSCRTELDLTTHHPPPTTTQRRTLL